MKKRIPILIVFVVAAVVLAVWLQRSRASRAEVDEVRLYGNVDIREVQLGFRVGGRLEQVLKDEGDSVTAAEVLAKLDDAPFRLEVQEARHGVESARARLDLLEKGSRPEEIAQAMAVVREREVLFGNAQRVFKRQEELLASKAVSQQERDDAEARFREAEARFASAGEQLKLLEAGFRTEEIEQARAALKKAQADQEMAELRLQDTVLKAPSEGVILTRVQERGAILQAGASVLTLSLRRPVWVRAYIEERRLGRVHPGLKVRVHTDSRSNQPYSGRVGFISPRAEFTPKNVETPELRTTLVYRLRIVVEDADEVLRQGMPVTVTLEPQ